MKLVISSLFLIGALAVLSAPSTAQRMAAGGVSGAGYEARYAGHGGYAASRVWIPARYETVLQRVWVPGASRRVWVEPVYRLRIGSCGGRFRVLVRAGHWDVVQAAGHYETRSVRVYHPGHWAARGSCD